jgi:RNA-directed DNA polymerase
MIYCDKLCAKYAINPLYFKLICRTATKRYKVYPIPKKNGGVRMISQPARKVKAYHYLVMNDLLKVLPVHACATAYEPGSSIKTNASVHRKSKFFVRFDLRSFFESFEKSGIKMFLLHSFSRDKFDDEDAEMIASLFCRNEKLTMGAPVSPMLTNRLMYDFDHSYDLFCSGQSLIYTRYADDMIVSSSRFLERREIEVDLNRFLSEFKYANLVINNQKTIVMSGSNRRQITGLNITNEHRVVVPRSVKRRLRSLIHSGGLGSDDTRGHIIGLVSYINSIEAGFADKMCAKYRDLATEMHKPDDKGTNTG